MATASESPFDPAELEQVSFWAQVAIAARGCRRLLPLLEVPREWPAERRKLAHEAAWHSTGVSLALAASAGGLSPSPTGVRLLFSALDPVTEKGNALGSAILHTLDAADQAGNAPSEGRLEELDALREGIQSLQAVVQSHGSAALSDDLRLVLSEGYGRGDGAADGRFLAQPLWRSDHFDLKEPATWLSIWERDVQEEGLAEQAAQLRREWDQGEAFDPKLAYDQFELWWQREQAKEVVQQLDQAGTEGSDQSDASDSPDTVVEEPPDSKQPAGTERPLLRMLADEPLKDDTGDLLHFAIYAEALAGLIDNRTTKTPFTVAINAPWGAGKSTLANMVRKRLEENAADGGEHPHVTCTFNAWLHDEAPNLASAFAAEVARAANRGRPKWKRFFLPLPLGLASSEEKRNHRLLTGLMTVASTFGLWWAMDRWWPEGVRWLTDAAGSLAGSEAKEAKALGGGGLLVFVAQQLLKRLGSMGLSLEDFVKKPEAAAGSGSMDGVRKQLGKLIAQATPEGSRFVIFIDDLERCKPPRAVDVLEVVNQLLGHEGVVTVILADMPSVAAAANMKYKEIAEQEQKAGAAAAPGGYGRNYLQKIIQLQFDLPAHSPGSVSRLAQNLARQRRVASAPATAGPAQRGWFGRTREMLFGGAGVYRSFRTAVEESDRGRGSATVGSRVGDIVGLVLVTPLVMAMRAVFAWAYPDEARRELVVASFSVGGTGRLDRIYSAAGALFGLIYLVGVAWIGIGLAALPFGSQEALKRFPNLFGIPFAEPWSNLLSLVVAFLALVATILGVLALALRRTWRRDQEATKQMTERVDELAEEVGPDAERIKEKLPEEARARLDVDALIRRRVVRHTQTDDELVDQATKDVFDYLPPMPRHAKRLVNQVRLLLSVARERGLFVTGVEPIHIGRWVTLRERWPDVAQRILTRHETLEELEIAARAEDPNAFRALVGQIAANLREDSSLRRFCAAEPRLGPVAWQLVFLEPPP